MKNLSILSFLFLSFICMAMTCNTPSPSLVSDEDTVREVPCIDREKIDPKRGCPRNIDPVCGCNDITYSNTCEAEKAGVTSFTKGKCNTDCVDASNVRVVDCPQEYDPVCGCNGKTYPNACAAKNAGVKKSVPGKCKPCIDKSKINPKQGCNKIYDPVCGCNRKTYANACEAEKAGVLTWEGGECEE